MIHNRKHVFTVTLDSSMGETPELLMTAIAMAVFDLAPALHDDDTGIGDERYDARDVLSIEEARKHVINGREVVMMFPKARACVTHIFASRLAPSESEIVLTMYDRDGDELLNRAGEYMDRLAAAQATDAGEEFDLTLEDILETDDEPAALPISA
ncbi:MAG: hypothetical protein RL272_1326 [Candidatus Parcubacteria bacterium]